MRAESIGALRNSHLSISEGRRSAPIKKSDVIPPGVRHEIVFNTIMASDPDLDKASLQELRTYSKAILYCITYGDNGNGENRLLRELYWDIVETVAHLKNGHY